MREKQPANGLEPALDLARIAAALAATSLTLDQWGPIKTELVSVAGRLRPPIRVGLPISDPLADPREVIAPAVDDIGTIKKPKDLKKAGKIASRLEVASDVLLSDALASLVYAPHLGDPQGPALIAGNVAAHHDFGLQSANGELRLRAPWAVPP